MSVITRPESQDAEFQQATRLLKRGRADRAREACRDLLKRRPQHRAALHLLASLSLNAGDPREAVCLFTRLIDLAPRDVLALCSRGAALELSADFGNALNDYDRAIAVDHSCVEAHMARALLLQRQGALAAALAGYDQVIRLQPEHTQAHCNRGIVQRSLGQPLAALASHDRAIALRPNFVEAYVNRGNAHRDLKHWERALDDFDRAIGIDAQCAQAHGHRGNLLNELNRLEEAIASYDRAIALSPEYVEAHCNRGVALLLAGRLEAGWKEYDWRRRRHGVAPQRLRWDKGALQGKTVLLQAEQGFGDTLQFCRYAPLLAACGARIVLQAQSPLLELMRSLEGVAQVIAAGDEPPATDLKYPLLSLPHLLGTRLDNIPAAGAYLHASESQVAMWRARLGPKTKPRIGLAWSGSTVHNNNRGVSLPVLLERLPRDYEYVVLQKELSQPDRTLIENRSGREFCELLRDFSATAALIDCMDLVISIDTAVAHLSGALARPTWVLLPFNPDWRWLLAREDTPWYPTMTLYRQSAADDWGVPLAKLSSDLERRFEPIAAAAVA